MRRRTVALLVLVMILTATGRDARGALAQAPGRAAPRVLAVDSALARAGERDLWPGFTPLRIPLAIYDRTDSYLLRHPNPPTQYRPLPAAPAVHLMAGLDPAITANSSAQLGGLPTATMRIGPAGRWRRDVDAGLAIHELFHVFQRAHHPSWIANEADLFTYPFDRADALALRREETDALARAVGATIADVAVGRLTDRGRDSVRCWGRAFVDLRARRFALLGSDAAAYERGTELNEGLARYVELRATGPRPFMLPAPGDSTLARVHNGTGEFTAEAVRQRAYETGAAMGLVLDRLRPDWRQRLDTARAAPALDAMLAEAVGAPTGRACSMGASSHAAWARAAQADVEGIRAAHAAARAR